MTTPPYTQARGIAYLQRHAVRNRECARTLADLRMAQNGGDEVAIEDAYARLDQLVPQQLGGVRQYSRVDATIVSRATRA